MDDGQTPETPRRHGADDGTDSVRVARWLDLLDALRRGPQRRDELLARLGSAYAAGDSGRRNLVRDIGHMNALGIRIDVEKTHPPTYILVGPLPVFTADELRALTLVRDSFGVRHPQSRLVCALLERLTEGLPEDEQELYERRPALRVPLEPAIDYTPYGELISRLSEAINRRLAISFRYHAPSRPSTYHRRVEPTEIEYRDRHFYLTAYTDLTRQFYDFRIDRIHYPEDFVPLAQIHPDLLHIRPRIVFRYRLFPPLSRGELSQRFLSQRVVERLPDDSVVVEAEDYNEFFIVRTLLRYAGSAELVEPRALRERMLAEIAALRRVYDV